LLNRFRFLLLTILLVLSSVVFGVDWQDWRYGDIMVRTAPKDSAYASLIVRSLHQRINSFQMKLGVYPFHLLQIVILPDRNEYRKITSGKGKIVQSSEAFYSPNEKVIYVRSPDQMALQKYDDVLMHEYIHWFLDETMQDVPLWFHEGMAFYYSGQYGFQAYYQFTRYRFMGYHISLNDMKFSYPADRNYWNMFYLTSAFAVSYLESKRNLQWLRFWDIVGFYYNRSVDMRPAKVDFIDVFHQAFGTSIYSFSKEYDKVLRRYSWQFPLVGINALIFSLLPLILVLGWLRNRSRMQALPELEDDESDEETELTDETTKTEITDSEKSSEPQ